MEQIRTKDGYVMRRARADDADAYFERNYNPLDAEVARMTGSKRSWSREEVVSFFMQSLADTERCYFLILDPDGNIVGESVINDIDRELRSANFRIALFAAETRGRGIEAGQLPRRDFAFETLRLHRLELDVYSFNPRAEKAYRKAGFRREGVRRDAVRDGQGYADDIFMAILEDEWRLLKEQNP